MHFLSLVIFVLFINSGFIYLTSAQTYDDAKALRSAILTGYDSTIRPVLNQTQALNVNISLTISSISIDTKAGSISVISALSLQWYDEKLVWNPSDYGGLTELALPVSDIWIPSIYIRGSVDLNRIGETWQTVRLFYNGHCLFIPPALTSSQCTFDVTYWPFDKQACELLYFTLDYFSDKVQFTIPENGFGTSLYVQDGEWILEDTLYRNGEFTWFSGATFTVKLKRQSEFYVLTVISPILGIGWLFPFVFLLTNEGDRIGYSVTLLLAIMVFLTVISEFVPKTSTPVPGICVALMFVIAVSTISLPAVIFNLNIYHRSDDIKMNSVYRFLVRVTKCRFHKESKETKVKPLEIEDYVKLTNEGKTNINTFFTDKKENVDESGLDNVTWKEVSYALDKMCFIVCMTCMIINVFIFSVYMPQMSEYPVL